MKKVVFVIVTRGKSDYLEKMLKEIIPYYRVILVDNSEQQLCSFLGQKYNLQYVVESIAGVSSARNAGAAKANNEDYIFFLDDDLEFVDGWKEALANILKEDVLYDCLGGRVIANYSLDFQVPEKYLYLLGEKELGTKKTVKNNYIGGCNLLIARKLFFQLGQFDTRYGHKGNILGLNEDVIFQDMVRRNNGFITYDPAIKFVHHWKGTKKQIFERVHLQGIYDRQVDLKMNKVRFFLRTIKYIFYITMYHLKGKNPICNKHFFDYLRYSAYVTNKKIVEFE